MQAKSKLEPQNPLVLRCHRLMEVFAKSDDERDFYLDRLEGFIIYADLDKSESELENLEKELAKNGRRYCLIPKLTFYETKKIMEGFVNEKVYDIDTKEKLLDIIQSKEARENFLEFIYDHHAELEKWQQFYQERSRIRIIEWLRQNDFQFVFEEDLEIPKTLIEKIKQNLFNTKIPKDVQLARKALFNKAKTYYSNEALNPRPKRGRPPKQAAKPEIEPTVTTDIYTTVPTDIRTFLFTPDITSASGATFSSKFETEEDLLASRKINVNADSNINLEHLNQKLASLRDLTSRWTETGSLQAPPSPLPSTPPPAKEEMPMRSPREALKTNVKASNKTPMKKNSKLKQKKVSLKKTATQASNKKAAQTQIKIERAPSKKQTTPKNHTPKTKSTAKKPLRSIIKNKTEKTASSSIPKKKKPTKAAVKTKK